MRTDMKSLGSKGLRLLAPFLIVATSPLSLAAHQTPKPGKYVTEGGSLTIDRASDGKTTFELVSVSPWNGHTCGPMEGEIRHQIWSEPVGSDVKAQPCTVKFLPNGEDVEVTSNGEACRDECGSAVTFDGIYVRLLPECDSPALGKTKRQFKTAYEGKDYAKARSILEAVVVHCGSALEHSKLDSMRNDLAITQYHLHDLAGCRQTVEHLREDAAKTDEELKSQYPVFAQDARLPGVSAARTNLKLCRTDGAAR